VEIKGDIDDTPPKPIGGKDTKDKEQPICLNPNSSFLDT
jgi:hypothetical protein